MSDHRSDLSEPDHRGEPRCSLDVARNPLGRGGKSGYCGTPRSPREPDEQGAESVIELLFSAGRDRLAFFRIDGTEQCRIVYLDRAAQPRTHAPGGEARHAEPVRQSAQRAGRQGSDAGPLFGSPGCAPPACTVEPQPPGSQVHVPAPAGALLCSRCAKPPPAGVSAIEGGTHWLTRSRNDASRPRTTFTRLQSCGKWRRGT